MKRRPWILFGLALALIAAGAGFISRIKAAQKQGAPGVLLDLPVHAVPFESSPVEVTAEERGALPQDTSFGRRLYSTVEHGETNYVMVSVVLMGKDRTSIHKPQFCLVGQGWRIEQTECTSILMEKPRAYRLPVMKLTASRSVSLEGGQTAMVRGIYVYWFVAEDCLTADHWQRMWWMAKDLVLKGVLQRWAYVSFFTTCAPGQEFSAEERIQRLMLQIVPQFQLPAGPVVTSAAK
jgi:hypothetical protein